MAHTITWLRKNWRFTRIGLTLCILLILFTVLSHHALAMPADEAVDHELNDRTTARNIEIVGQLGGASDAVFVVGGRAYLGEGPRMIILDVSTPETPVVLGKSDPLPDIVADIQVVGNVAYVAVDKAGLILLDVSDPASLNEIARHDTPGNAKGVMVAGNLAYVADGAAGLRILDISNPTTPNEAGHQHTPGFAENVFVENNIAYVADSRSGLRLIDVSEPSTPVELGAATQYIVAYDVVVVDDIAYVTEGGLTFADMHIIDVSNPSAPVKLAAEGFADAAYGVAVDNGLAFVARGSYGFEVIDVTDPSSPQEVGIFDTPGLAQDIAIVDDLAYLADGLRILDISNPSDPEEIGVYAPLGWAMNVEIAGNTAYVADEDLHAFEISEPTMPIRLGSLYGSEPIRSLTVADDRAYTTELYSRFLNIVDVSDPGALADVIRYEGYHWVSHVTAIGDIAYLANYQAGLRLIDLTDFSYIRELGHFRPSGDGLIRALHVEVVDNMAYVADLDVGIRLIELADPASPSEVSIYGDRGGAIDVAVKDDTAYVLTIGGGENACGLGIVDVSDPDTPTETAYFEMSVCPVAIAVAGNLIYTANEYAGVRVLNVSNSSAPREVGFFDTAGRAFDVETADGLAYVADHSGGLYTLQFVAPTYTYLPLVGTLPD